jgi:hypothetical protein
VSTALPTVACEVASPYRTPAKNAATASRAQATIYFSVLMTDSREMRRF